MSDSFNKDDFDLIISKENTERNYWFHLWKYRDLFLILTWRDIKVRYKQTVLGVLWSVIKPLLSMLVFTFVFGRLANLNAGTEAPYAIMVYAGLLPWYFFSNSLTESSNSLVSNAQLISKVYFPRIIIPTSTFITSLIDFLISFGILIALMVYFKFVPNWHILFLPVFLFIAFLTSFGIGLFITALNVKYRDFRYIIPFIIQFGLFISPVGYSSSIVPEKWALLYSLNPLVGVIDGFRWCILGEDNVNWNSLLISCFLTIIILFFSIRYFRKMEKTFADFI